MPHVLKLLLVLISVCVLPVDSNAQAQSGQRQARTLTGEWQPTADPAGLRNRSCAVFLKAEGWSFMLFVGSERTWSASLSQTNVGPQAPAPNATALRVESDVAIPALRLVRAESGSFRSARGQYEAAVAEPLLSALRSSRAVLIFSSPTGELLRLRVPNSDPSEGLTRFTECLAWLDAADIWTARDSLEFLWSSEQSAGSCQVTARDGQTGAFIQATLTPGRVLLVLGHETFRSAALRSRWLMDLQITPGIGGGFSVPVELANGVFRATLPRSPEVEGGILAMLQGAELTTGRRGPINISAILPPAHALLARVRTCIRQLEDPPAEGAPQDTPPSRRT